MTQVYVKELANGSTGPRGITTSMYKAALQKHAGIFSYAALELGVSRQAVFQRVARSPELQLFLREIEEALLDAVEEGIADLILNKRDPATLRWYADRKGAGRGYGVGKRHEAFQEAPRSVEVTVHYVDSARRLDD